MKPMKTTKILAKEEESLMNSPESGAIGKFSTSSSNDIKIEFSVNPNIHSQMVSKKSITSKHGERPF